MDTAPTSSKDAALTGKSLPLGNRPQKAEAELGLGLTEQVDRIDQLISCYIDGEMDEATITELNTLLASDESARDRYTNTVMLHADLIAFFSDTDQRQSS